MKIHFITIALDAMPWIAMHLPTFNRLSVSWEWHVVEGVAKNVHCTSWCKQIQERLSKDGTTELLESIAHHPRIHLYQSAGWDGKIQMVNRPLYAIKEPCLLWQIDGDEIWQPSQIETVCAMFKADQSIGSAAFRCRYYVGPHLIVRGRNCYGNRNQEWLRVWRFSPGMLFATHEPPEMTAALGVRLSPDDTFPFGLVFDHYAYATKHQVEFKETYYGYAGAVGGWERLQKNTTWPAMLSDFFPWVHDSASVMPL